MRRPQLPLYRRSNKAEWHCDVSMCVTIAQASSTPIWSQDRVSTTYNAMDQKHWDDIWRACPASPRTRPSAYAKVDPISEHCLSFSVPSKFSIKSILLSLADKSINWSCPDDIKPWPSFPYELALRRSSHSTTPQKDPPIGQYQCRPNSVPTDWRTILLARR